MSKRCAFLSVASMFILVVLAACGSTRNSSSDAENPLRDGVEYGTMTDNRDGQIYKTVKIGEQTWMAENLNYKFEKYYKFIVYGNGFEAMGEEGYEEERISSYCYEGFISNCVKFGYLYPQKQAVNACPVGWHLPDTTEWNALFSFVGGKNSAGKNLKSSFGWLNGGNGVDDYGFSVLPAGAKGGPNSFGDFFSKKDDVYYIAEEKNAVFWSSVDSNSVSFYYYKDSISINKNLPESAFSVRCVQNDSLELSNYSSSESATSSSSSQKVELDSLVDTRDGQIYKTVKFRGQVWMAQNLNYKKDESYCRANDDSNCDKYGRLYTWSAAQNACPVGWHLPTKSELQNLLGKWRQRIRDGWAYVIKLNLAGNALKSSDGWFNGQNGFDEIGFAALPGGIRFSDGSYSADGESAFFWSSSEENDGAYGLSLYYYDKVDLDVDDKKIGMSVRCLKGEPAVDLSSSSMAKSSSSLKVEKGSVTDSRDGRLYKTVTIGKQTWMAENLNYATVGSFCYQNEYRNCAKYGRLYTWASAVDSVNILRATGKECGYDRRCSLTKPVQGACPAGWHLPTKAEWDTLERVAGPVSWLKSKDGWINGNGKDVYGFSALPAGDKDIDGTYLMGYIAAFWSSSEEDVTRAWYERMQNDFSSPYEFEEKNRGFSVRCVKDEITSENERKTDTEILSSSSVLVEPGSMTDERDGQTYKTVRIGSQTWMAENLNFEMENSSCERDTLPSCAEYGRYYKWAAAKNACPAGWHLPDSVEWNTLFATVGGDSVAGRTLHAVPSNKCGRIVGWSKCSSGLEWNFGISHRFEEKTPRIKLADRFGFTALQSGLKEYETPQKSKEKSMPRHHSKRKYGDFGYAEFWSSMDRSFVNLYDDKPVEWGKGKDVYEIPIRCVLDSEPPVAKSKKAKPVRKKKATILGSATVSPLNVVKDSLVDGRDGKIYKTVKIGKQTWMAENLNYKTTDSYCLGDSLENCAKYGRLYKGNAANEACPGGWHLSTRAEWENLFKSVGGPLIAGFKLKDAQSWYNDRKSKDEYGFSVLPGAKRNEMGEYFKGGLDAYFWTPEKHLYWPGRSPNYDVVHFDYVTSKASVIGASVIEFSFSLSSDEREAHSVRCVMNDVDAVESSSSKMSSSSSAKSSSSSSSFSVVSPSSVIKGTMIDSRDNQVYQTVTVGTQTWMAQNLNYQTANSYCYKGELDKCAEYGRFYTWAVAMDSVGEFSPNGKGCGYMVDDEKCKPKGHVRGICPEGWHLPSFGECNDFIGGVGGKFVAGKMLRSTVGWKDNGNGSDDYSFSALPTGLRDGKGNFKYTGETAGFWTSTESRERKSYLLLMYSGIESVELDGYRDSSEKNYGANIRCIKD
ncbi:FISUMP domain-containing protein [Fibrobacter sp. UWB11]|uniref:FISUMP domain-containing protein n=1 Tax=Fibrobacter sp. UWB11 TaxID=1896202 RepID=UPI00092C5255|nr:FISUMP domain-containing protein [Fibrobacter sp. UWB11]SIO45430.1 major paralogous domain-containing protein [Fibrobacter sp. UWB11]